MEELPSLLEKVVSQEIQQLRKNLQNDLRKDLSEIRSLMKSITTQSHVPARPRLKKAVSGFSDASGKSNDEHPHAWVGRNVRSYAAAVEIAAMTDEYSEGSGITPEGLLGKEIAKGSGPLSRLRCQPWKESARLGGAQGRSKVKKKSNPQSAAGARHQARASTDPTAKVTRFDAALSGGEDESNGMSGSKSEPQFASGLTVPSSGSLPELHVSTSLCSSVSNVTPVSDFTEQDSELNLAAAVLPSEKRAKHPAPVPKLATIPSQKTLSLESLAGKARQVRRRVKPQSCRGVALRIVASLYFDYLTVLFIVGNALTIGLQTNHMAMTLQEEVPASFQTVDAMFSIFFGVEVAIRLLAYGTRFFWMPSWKWNILDLVVVSLQLLEEIMVSLKLGESQVPVALSLMRMLRILRLVRVLRVVRLLRYMSELRTLVVSIMSSVKPLVSSVALLALVIYMVAIYFTQLALHHRLDMACGEPGNCESEHDIELGIRYGSVGVTILNLFQSVTGGLEWRFMSEPLMKSISPWMGLIYGLYIIFTSLALMNLVTGVFVESALARGREDKDTYMINHLRDLFGAMDMNRNGQISWCELEEHLDDPKLITFFKEIDIDISEARGLFELLDRDGSGTIDADEFLSGCLRLRGAAKAIDLQLVMCELAEQRRSFQKLLQALEEPSMASEGLLAAFPVSPASSSKEVQ